MPIYKISFEKEAQKFLDRQERQVHFMNLPFPAFLQAPPAAYPV